MPGTVPAVDGWFTAGDQPHLIGARCSRCGTYAFPPQTAYCPNPACDGTGLDPVELSRTGSLWSFTVNHYPPPPPALSPDPFEPYAVAAVELPAEQLLVLGKVADGVDLAALAVGAAMELVVEPIVSGHEELVWKWRPAR